jgi:hypothetical protein
MKQVLPGAGRVALVLHDYRRVAGHDQLRHGLCVSEHIDGDDEAGDGYGYDGNR